MRLTTILFTLLISCTAFASDSNESGDLPLMNTRGHYASAPMLELNNNEDYDSMATTLNSSVEANDMPDDNIADYSMDDRD